MTTPAVPDALAAVEADVRRLLREAAEARHLAGERERTDADSRRKLLLALLEVLDAFDRVFRSIQSKESEVTPQVRIWVGNFRAVRRLLLKAIEEEGVVRIENIADGFDPSWHTIAEVVGDPSRANGTIVEEVRPGYVWKGQVLRKTEVIAVRNE